MMFDDFIGWCLLAVMVGCSVCFGYRLAGWLFFSSRAARQGSKRSGRWR